MTCSRRGLLPVLALLSVLGGAASAQAAGGGSGKVAPQYAIGDEMFGLGAGFFLPLFYQDETGATAGTNLTFGGIAGLEWDAFLTNNVYLGAELAGNFSFSPNSQTLLLVALTPTIGYVFRFYPFEIPIFFGAGVNLSYLSPQLYVGPIAKPGVGFYWYFTSQWMLGLKAEYWWVPEIYFPGWTPGPSASRFGNFLSTSAFVVYHF